MKARVLIFWENDFPFVDTAEIDQRWLVDALPPVDSVKAAGVEELRRELRGGKVDLLINPYGSAFPKAAWPEILAYLEAGGSFMNLGGAPFSLPVRRDGDGWYQEIRQTAYHRDLGINQVATVVTGSVRSYETMDTEPLLSGLIDGFSCDQVFELQLRLTNKPDHPEQVGSSGAREATCRPLIHGLDENGRRLVAPVIALDRVFGRFAGGRWVLASYAAASAPRKDIITRLAGFAALGASEFQVRPSFACYFPDERATLVVHASRLKDDPSEARQLNLYLTIRKDKITIANENVEIKNFRSPYYHVIPLGAPLSPGLYTIEARLSTGDTEFSDKYASYHTTGFWCYDAPLISTTQPLSAGKDFFMRGDKPSPLCGTTYMASDVHRRFLMEPNPYVWDRDFAEMKATGINIIRTGFWTAFRHAMLDPGVPNEGIMRAFTAFMLTAAQHEIPVIFNLFAFAPELYEGENPYLDQRCLQAQKEFVSAFARRFAGFNNLMWDLINEPSFPSHGRYWSCKPNHDGCEDKAWQDWVRTQCGDGDDLTERWRTTPAHPCCVPALSDFDDPYVYKGEGHMRLLDFRLFAQVAFVRWIREMTLAIRANGNPKQLITVGQDEGGQGARPNPQFFHKEVDFTGTHTWWLNDDLLWSGLVSNTPEKPSLVEETGVMNVEDPGRTARRTEADCRNLAERKFVMSFASGCAGFVQWIWNTNIYMPDDNEAAIGFHRGDLTAKPELEPVSGIMAFIREARPYLLGREPEQVCMVLPYSDIFNVRDLSSLPARAAVRVMHYHCGVPMRVVGEYCLENLGSPRLILLPCPRVLTQQAWDKLMQAVEHGASLLVTGPVEWDEYRRPVDRLSVFEMQTTTRPVTREEETIILGEEYRLSFSGDKIHRVDKAIGLVQPNMVKTEQAGSGKLIYATLPFEWADNVEPTVALYGHALKQAVVQSPFTVEKIDPCLLIRPQSFRDSILYCVVSETDADKEFELTDNLTGRVLSVRIPAQRAAMFLLDRKDGRVMAEYGGAVAADPPGPTAWRE